VCWPCSGAPNVDFPPPKHLRYQLFHRTTSAVIDAERPGALNAVKAVHRFSPTHEWLHAYQRINLRFQVREGLGKVASINQREPKETWSGARSLNAIHSLRNTAFSMLWNLQPTLLHTTVVLSLKDAEDTPLKGLGNVGKRRSGIYLCGHLAARRARDIRLAQRASGERTPHRFA
jgi:hypothetical protein